MTSKSSRGQVNRLLTDSRDAKSGQKPPCVSVHYTTVQPGVGDGYRVCRQHEQKEIVLDDEVVTVTEQLADEFNDLPGRSVAIALEQCRDDFPAGSSHFIAQAARARLRLIRRRRRR
ncbi:MAG: hypothetical protein ACXVXC_11625 [Nocardioidaceae bacterium]